jgi:hypothetical protein
MEELWQLHYNRLISVVENNYKPQCKTFLFFDSRNFIKDESVTTKQKKSTVLFYNGKRYRKIEDDENLANVCEVDVKFFKRIKEDVFPKYLQSS